MFLRILLIVIGSVTLVFGLFFLLAPDTAIQEFQTGVPDAALRLSTRELGGGLISLTVINWLSSTDKGSRALRAVIAGNILYFLFNTGLDFTESFPATEIWYGVTILKVVFILALGYFLVTWKEPARA